MFSLSDRLSLRWRLILTMVTMVTVSTAVFSTGIVLIKNRLEAVTFGELVSGQMDIILNQPSRAINESDRLFPEWQFHDGEDAAVLPDPIRQLPDGSYHSITMRDRYYQLEVRTTEEHGKAYLFYDIDEWERQEHTVLLMTLAGSVLVLIIAILLADGFSRAVLAPLDRLTRRLRNLSPYQRGVRIAGDFRGREVHRIASAFDHYQKRMDRFVERETFFTAAASHELRTPLSVIMGAGDILEQRLHDDPSARRALQRIQRACGDMQGFIEVTLLLAREENRSLPDEHETSISEQIQKWIRESRPALQQIPLHVHEDLAGDLCVRQAPGVVTMVIGNVLKNALDHAGAGDLWIRQHGSTVEIRDNGAGIHPEDLPRVFDRDFTTRADGTGMGLNLVQRICERFRWKIRIASEPGLGTTVILDFSATAVPCSHTAPLQ